MSDVLAARRLAISLVVLAAGTGSARADLLDYVKKPDAAFSWKLKEKKETADGTVYDLHLVSQVWQGITWEHQLQVYLPKGVKPTATMFLWNQGGKSSPASVLFGMDLAKKMNAPVAFLFGIPNQPLFGGLKEDALIAETFVRYLETKDESWPLLFPMVKSLVRAMDALQAFAKQEWNIEVTHFVVSGGSKRGWTTWLTAAADARVKALAPCVIDTLNMGAQLPHQLKSYGKYSEMIGDYTKRGLVPMPNTPEAKRLWMMVDPWMYRDRIKQPRMIVNGTNDPYWTQDALNLYWDDLKGNNKWVLYVPNAGHNLAQRHDNAGLIPDLTRAGNTLAAFARHQIYDIPMPKVQWAHEGKNPKMRLKVEADPAPKAARLWSTTGATRDFRRSKWSDRPLEVNGKTITVDMEAPAEGYIVFFAELEYEVQGLRYFLSTQLRIAGNEKTTGQIELKKGDRIMFFGDSLTNLAGREEPKKYVTKGYVRIVQEKLNEAHKGDGIEVDWVATGGHTVPDLLKRVDNDVIAKKPNIVVIQIGCNDARRIPKEVFKSSLEELIGRLQMANIQVVQCTLTSVGEKYDGTNKDDPKLDEFAEIERQVAQAKKVPLNDLRKAFVTYWKENNPQNLPSGILTYDGNHFNDAGHRFVAEQMLKRFK
jgi:PhoPQ-activated pathogenicity-related protein/lysophospholipase L1-like esterase